MTKPTPIRIKAWLVTYHTSHGPGALLFCSRICEDAALEPFDRPGQTVRFSEHVARAIVCYGCGLNLWEATVEV